MSLLRATMHYNIDKTPPVVMATGGVFNHRLPVF